MKVTVLEYHDVVPDGDVEASGFPGRAAATYKLDAGVFERHLVALEPVAADHVTTVTDVIRNGAQRQRALLLTFDDGGVGAIAHTAGLLERRGWRGHFFVTVDHVGKPGFLDRAAIRELHGRGHVIGSHTCSHPPMMATLPYAAIFDEWRRSVMALGDIVGEPVTTASVPGGLYSRLVASAAGSAGIRALFTSEPVSRCWTVEGCLVLGRYTIRRWTSPTQAQALAAGHLFPRAAQWGTQKALRLLRRLGGPAYLRARAFVLNRR